MYTRSIFIFRREFRLDDNIGLMHALEMSGHVVPIFIFTPEQVTNNMYGSNMGVQFMVESLISLDKELKNKGSKLNFFYGRQHEIVEKLIRSHDVEAVFVNRDYTPYAKKRDGQIEKVCNKMRVQFHSYEDYLLNPAKSIVNGSGDVYVKFTPYFRKAKAKKVDAPKKNKFTNYYKKSIGPKNKNLLQSFYVNNDDIAVRGGRENAQKILKGVKKFVRYGTDKNYLYIETTHLSAYIKFGCVSIREVYAVFVKELGKRNDLVRQLYWRDFYYNVVECHPGLLSNDWSLKNLRKNNVKWITYKNATSEQKKQWKAWCLGKTGFPVVDACMRQLNKTGFMHNRGRMIVSSFLVKNMFWHYGEGERYFARKLVDYDPANNIGGWGFISGVCADSQPYFRIFNPWLQSKKYDPDCVYIKKWVPELAEVDCNDVHKWNECWEDYDVYLEPILDYHETARKVVRAYKSGM